MKKIILNFEERFFSFFVLDSFNVFGFILNEIVGHFCSIRNIAWHEREKREIDRE